MGVSRGKFIIPGKIADNVESYANIPDSIDHFFVLEYILNISQYTYDKYISGEISKKKFEDYARDQSYLDRITKEDYRYKLAVLSAVDSGKKYIWCDANNNMNFADDLVIKFDLDSLKSLNTEIRENLQTITIHYDHFYKGKKFILEEDIKLIPYSSSYRYKDPAASDLQVYFSADQHQFGKMKIDKEEYEIRLPAGLGNSYEMIYLTDSEGTKLDYDPWITLGDTIKLNDTNIVFSSLTEFADTLTVLKFKKNLSTSGYRVGNSFELTDFKELVSNLIVQPSKFDHEYILLDFWGTWCKPCIEQLPGLIDFNDRFKKNVNLISIAYDKDDGVVKKFVRQNNMNWLHKFESSSNENQIGWVKNLKIDCFPTFILLTKNFEILYRGCGESALENIDLLINN